MVDKHTARDAWTWTAAQRQQRVVVEEPLRPREMLARYGYDARVACGDCRHYLAGTRAGADRCRLSLRGSPPSIGYRWFPAWRGCGAWQPRAVTDRPDPAPADDQPRLF